MRIYKGLCPTKKEKQGGRREGGCHCPRNFISFKLLSVPFYHIKILGYDIGDCIPP